MTFFPPWTSRALPSKIIYLHNAKINTKIKSDGCRFFDKNAKKDGYAHKKRELYRDFKEQKGIQLC